MWVYGIIAVLALNLPDYQGTHHEDDYQSAIQTERSAPIANDVVIREGLTASASVSPEVGPLPIDSALGYGVSVEDTEETDERDKSQDDPQPDRLVCCEYLGLCMLLPGDCPEPAVEVECPCIDRV
ncbi:MAG: hypothetical protein JSU86_13395 [Phycisphaerales bacterium]|nr:MAG: hypothetical protein JSU86_13395 [Phycisphaerales bacterium]